MTDRTFHYIYDPLCGWCYAASPLIRAVADAGISIVLHGGGLFAQPTHVDAAKRAYMRQSDARIAQMAGVTFGSPYLDGLLGDPGTVFWSRPPIAAILAAGSLEPGAGLGMLAGIQYAHYVEGRRVVEAPVLAELAGAIGLNAAAFERAFAAAPLDDHLIATHALMRRAGAQGFPVMLIERGGTLARVDHQSFYGRPAEFVEALGRAG